MAIIKSGASGDQLTIGPTSKAARVEQYDAAGNPIALADRTSGITPGTTRGLPIMGADYKTQRLARVGTDGALSASNAMLQMFDSLEGTTQNTQAWLVMSTTMTFSQAAGVLTFNSGSSVSPTVGCGLSSLKPIPLPPRGRALFRSRQRHTAHSTNSVFEIGFLNAITATTTVIAGSYSGAIWRKDGTGQYIPVLAIGGSEYFGTGISNATFTASITTSQFADFEVEVDATGAWFRIYKADGTIFNEQRVDLDSTLAGGLVAATHLFPCVRQNQASGTGSAVQLIMGTTAAWALDFGHEKPWSHQIVGAGAGCFTTPATYTSITNWSNQAAPTTRTPANSTAGETTLGGHTSWNNAGTTFAGNDAVDVILFGYQVPSPYGLYLTGSRISTVNLGAANGAAIYTIEYFLAINANSAALSTSGTVAPRFIPLGFQSLANAAAIGAMFAPETIWQPQTPVYIAPNRYVCLCARVIGASVGTASQVIRTIWTPEGYFE